MLIISGTDISLTRGNSAVIEVTPYLTDPQEPVAIGEHDKVVFRVKSGGGYTKLTKELTAADITETGSLLLRLSPQDTLALPEDTFFYDMLYVYEDGEAYTFIPRSQFVLLPAVATVSEEESHE